MHCDVIIPVGPGHEELHKQAIDSVRMAAMNKGMFTQVNIKIVDDTKGELGRSKARNSAILESEADWLFFLDADDLMHPHAFKVISGYPFVDALWGNIWETANGVCVWRYQVPELKTYQELISFPPYYTLQMGHFVKTSVAKDNLFDESMDVGEDFDYYLRLWNKYECMKVEGCLFLNRKGAHSTGPRSATGSDWTSVTSRLISEARGEKSSRCGPGSSKENTVNIRKFLHVVIEEFGIKSVNDLGCGDLYWYTLEDYPVNYAGFDDNVRPEALNRLSGNMQVTQADILSDSIPEADLSICKDVFRHHSDEGVADIIMNLSSRYLLADYDLTHSDGGTRHRQLYGDAQYDIAGNYCDLRKWLGEPIRSIESNETDNKRYGLWKIHN